MPQSQIVLVEAQDNAGVKTFHLELLHPEAAWYGAHNSAGGWSVGSLACEFSHASKVGFSY